MNQHTAAVVGAASTRTAAPSRARTVWAGVLIGVGIAAFLDETVFHQLLHWHHFYDRSTPGVGLVSDGLFHAFGWFAIVIGLVMVADLVRRGGLSGRSLAAGILLGAGAFQLYDGTVQHKLMKLHQIRYHVDLVPYDWTWDGLAVLVLVVGVPLLRVPDAPLGPGVPEQSDTGGPGPAGWLAAGLAVASAMAYLAAVVRLSRRGRSSNSPRSKAWPASRPFCTPISSPTWPGS